MRIRLTIIFFTFFCSLSLLSQEKKTLNIKKTNVEPKIDGILNDSIWKSLSANGNFHMWQPGNVGKVSSQYKTEVKMAYDNTAVYIAAYMFDPNPEEILNQLSQRDEIFVQADRFYIALNTYNDGINET